MSMQGLIGCFACETLIFDASALLSVHSTFHIIQNAAETELRRHFLQFAYFVHYVVENLYGLNAEYNGKFLIYQSFRFL